MSLIDTSSVVYWIGDSITNTFTGSASVWVYTMIPLRRRTLADSALLIPVTSRKAPLFGYVNSASGRAYKDVPTPGATMAGFARQFTHVVFQLGINDAQLVNLGLRNMYIADGNPSIENDINVSVASALAQSPNAIPIFMGPWGHDAGDYAVQIGQVNGLLQAKATATGGHFIQWSDLPNTIPSLTADGVHPTVAGAQMLATRNLETL